MLKRLTSFYDRYCRLHLSLGAIGGQLGPDCRIDAIELKTHRLMVRGKARYAKVTLRLNGAEVSTLIEGQRNAEGWADFSLSLPYSFGALQLIGQKGSQSVEHHLPAFGQTKVKLARFALLFPFMAATLASLRDSYLWQKHRDPMARERIKERLGLIAPNTTPMLNQELFTPAPIAHPHSAASLVLPVYNALDYLKEALNRIEVHSDLPLHLILVEDCSSDPLVRPFLTDWAQQKRRFAVTLLFNEVNLGFVGTANRGMAKARELAPDQPVILFNSDAMVAKDWVSRLLAPLADPSVASVTPMSNDAEIFNIPVCAKRVDLTEGLLDHLDAAAAKLNPLAAIVPTGVGFCMAMAPAFLAKVPQFDRAFGRGYGEENDWCQKVIALGGKNIGIGNLFVEHRGGTSFGSEAKLRLIAEHGAELARRYPNYGRDVQDFILNDPLASNRMALGLVWASRSQDDPVTVWLAHSMAGGAEHDLQRRLKDLIAKGQSSVVLRVGGVHHRWRLELHSRLGVSQVGSNDAEAIAELIALLEQRRVIYSCAVGDRAPLEIPAYLARLAGYGPNALCGGPQQLEVLFHDFFPVSPSYTLLNSKGRYDGPPMAQNDDPAHRPNAKSSLKDWQAAWGNLIAYAQDLTVFSASSAQIVAQIWPDHQDKIRLRPHQMIHQIPPMAAGQTRPPVLGVLGNINSHKGAKVLQKLQKVFAKSGQMKLVVIGDLEPGVRLGSGAKVHGAYDREDLAYLVSRYGISGWFIPSIWPETFSFTTHEVLATQLPVFAFDLGAQADAIGAALAQGHKGALLPLEKAFDLTAKDFMPFL